MDSCCTDTVSAHSSHLQLRAGETSHGLLVAIRLLNTVPETFVGSMQEMRDRMNRLKARSLAAVVICNSLEKK